MNVKITYIDVDDVLMPTTKLIMSELKHKGIDQGVTYESLNTYDAARHPLIGADFMSYCKDSDFMEQIEIKEEYVKALAEIMELSDITYLYTGCMLEAQPGRTSWYLKLIERLEKYTDKRLVICYSGWPKNYPSLDFFCIIEDYAEILIPPTAQHKFLISQPWNKKFHDNSEMGNVVNSFLDIPEILRNKK